MRSAFDELAGNSTLRGLWSDERLTHLDLDPVLAGLAAADDGKTYDIIVAQPSQSPLLRNAALDTDEFYRGVRGKLAPEGIFCQRLNYFDYGPQVVRRVVCTFHRTFPNIIVTEAALGSCCCLDPRTRAGSSTSRR